MKIFLPILFLLSGNYLYAQYSGGSGTVPDPYQISTLTDLETLGNTSADWSKHFIQTSDIDASATLTWNSGAGFKSIGSVPDFGGVSFKGSYNGDNHVIDHLFMKRQNSDYQGFFGYVGPNATISNLGLTNDSIIARDNTGSLIGMIENSSVTNCFTNGYLKGNSQCGGLIGFSAIGTITDCHSSGKIVSLNYTGGIVGRSHTTTINKCYSDKTITCSGEGIGGIAGYYQGTIRECFSGGKIISTTGEMIGGLAGGLTPGTKIENCYSFTDVSGDEEIGGFIGKLGVGWNNSIPDTIRNCYSYGKVNGNTPIGGFSGVAGHTFVKNCFWDFEKCTDPSMPSFEYYLDSAGITRKTSAQMKTQSTFTDWDFTDIWQMGQCSNKGYPVFVWQTVLPGTSPDNGVTVVNNVLTSQDTESDYQWVDCNGFTVLDDETDISFTPVSNGSYAVIVTSETQCTDTSDCFTISTLSIDESPELDLNIYPNPVKNTFVIDLANQLITNISVTTMEGKSVSAEIHKSGNQLLVKMDVESGTYLVNVQTQSSQITRKIVVEN